MRLQTQLEDALRQENVPPTLRAENLDTDVFLRLSHRLRPLPAV
jgi:16S rRNA A1518/A1519 N6-dimethyltransferase RsmA/KsgA/DIM1 with predicted DNA glycosylase/AP lyase activity